MSGMYIARRLHLSRSSSLSFYPSVSVYCAKFIEFNMHIATKFMHFSSFSFSCCSFVVAAVVVLLLLVVVVLSYPAQLFCH